MPITETLEVVEKSRKYPSFFIDNYEDIKLIKSGGFGTVYKASRKKESNPKVVAVKLVELTAENPYSKATKEVLHTKNLIHPHIIQIFTDWLEKPPVDYRYPERKLITKDCKEGVVFIEMEFGELESLKEWLIMNWRNRENARVLFYQITSGLKFLHAQKPPIVHRDMKPENIILFRDHQSQTVSAKIADFGISSEIKTRMTSRIGTDGYIAPEVRIAGGIYTEKADVYALGVIYHEMLVRSDRESNDLKLYKDSGILDLAMLQPAGFEYPEEFSESIKEDKILLDMMLQKEPNDRQPTYKILETFLKLHKNMPLTIPIPIHITKEIPGEFRLYGSKSVPEVFQGISPYQPTALIILNLHHVKIDSKTFTSSLKSCINLSEINMVVIRENEHEGFEKISLPNMKKFIYRQLNGPPDFHTAVTYLTPKQIDSIFFAGPLDQIVASKMTVGMTVTRFHVINIKYDESDENQPDVVLGYCHNGGILKSVMDLCETKSLHLNVPGNNVIIDLDKFRRLEKMTTFSLHCRKWDVESFQRLYSFKYLETLTLDFHCTSGEFDHNPPTVFLSKLTPTLKNLTLYFALVSLDDVTSLEFEALNVVNCRFTNDLNLENISENIDDVHLGEILVFHDSKFKDNTFYQPTWKLLNKVIQWNYRCKISFEKFLWESDNAEGLIDEAQLEKWGIPPKTSTFRIEKSNDTGPKSGKPIDDDEKLQIHRQLGRKDKFIIPTKDDEYFSPSSRTLVGDV